jgi:hypothetical protein
MVREQKAGRVSTFTRQLWEKATDELKAMGEV